MPDDQTTTEAQSKAERAASVSRMLNDEDPPVTAAPNPARPSAPAPGTEAVGESVTRHGEDVADEDGKEPGRHDLETDSPTGRLAGTSDARDVSGVTAGEDG